MTNNNKLKCPKCGFTGIPNIKLTTIKAAYCSRCDTYIMNLPKGQKNKKKKGEK